MSLTLGHAPLSPAPGVDSNYEIDSPAHKLLFDDFPRRVRAEVDGTTVLDTTRGKLLHESAILPVLYVPVADLAGQHLEPSEHTTHCPFKGDAAYWHLVVGDRRIEDAVWGYDDPLERASWLAGYRAVYWHEVDRWLDEDEEVRGHLRDPYHRVDVRTASRPVEVRLGDEVVARSERPLVLSETGLPNRWYLPRADVRGDLLAESETTTHCPYKGDTTYFHVKAGDRTVEDAAWAYEDVLEDGSRLPGHVCFVHDDLTVLVDGHPDGT